MSDFNFIIDEPDTAPLVPEVVNKSLTELSEMTPRKFGQAILKVFGMLGGTDWLLVQAQIDPRGFIELLKKILPRQIEMDNLDGLTVLLRDQYGNELEINTLQGNTLGRASPTPATGGDLSSGPGQPLQIAASGNPTMTKSGVEPSAEVKIKEVFD